MLIADNEAGAEVVMTGNTYQQSKIIFDMCVHWSRQIDPNYNEFSLHMGRDIEHYPTSSVLHVISTNPRGLDGMNISFAIIDEYHAAPNSMVRDVIKTSMGMR